MDKGVILVKTWEECQFKFREIEEQRIRLQKEKDRTYISPQLYYRGQGNAEWHLKTTLERTIDNKISFEDYYRIISRIHPQVETFTGKIWEIPKFHEPDSHSLLFGEINISAQEYVIYLRHHCFPSPLLDWTRSPYIAAFFAFNDIHEKVQDVSIFVYLEWVGRGKSHRRGDPLISRLNPYIRSHERHFLQQSEYTICTIEENGINYFVSHENILSRNGEEQDILWKINIPSSERSNVLSYLDSININAFSLFGSEESLMNTLAFREFHLKKQIP